MSEQTAVATTAAKAVVASPADKLRAKLEPMVPQLREVLPAVYTPERLMTLLLLAATRSPELHQATTASLAQAIMDVARMGLDLAPGSCYIVVRNVNVAPKGQPKQWEKRACAEPDYRGLMQLAVQAGVVRSFDVPVVVYEADRFEEIRGLNPDLIHVPAHGGNRGPIVGAYVCYRLRTGERTYTFLPIADIEALRAKSQSWGPDKVKTCPPWYAQKAVIRHVCNRYPKQSRALAAAMDVERQREIEDAEVAEWLDRTPVINGATRGAVVTADPYGHGDAMPTDAEVAARLAVHAPTDDDDIDELPGSLPMTGRAA
jgi:phage RecT family recombinase